MVKIIRKTAAVCLAAMLAGAVFAAAGVSAFAAVPAVPETAEVQAQEQAVSQDEYTAAQAMRMQQAVQQSLLERAAREAEQNPGAAAGRDRDAQSREAEAAAMQAQAAAQAAADAAARAQEAAKAALEQQAAAEQAAMAQAAADAAAVQAQAAAQAAADAEEALLQAQAQEQAAAQAAAAAQAVEVSQAALQGPETAPGQAAAPESAAPSFALSTRNLDRQIMTAWEVLPGAATAAVEVTSAGSRSEKTVSAAAGVYTFSEGTHGNLYTIKVTQKNSDGAVLGSSQTQALFLDFGRLPALPVIRFETENGVIPTCEPQLPPDAGLAGQTIKNNEYVRGTLEMTGTAAGHVVTGMKMKVRGNTSANGIDKKPYKLKLDEKADLLGLGSSYAGKDWVLLNTGYSLNTFISGIVASECRMEYVPAMRFVNVILNGDWRGIYILTQPVQEGKNYVNVGRNGYIFENDSYWWSEGEVWFKTTYQPYQMGYTFKYPDMTGNNDPKVTALQRYMQFVEKKIYSCDESVWNYIDADTFAGWIMARDILGQSDAAGSNIYFYLEDFDANDYSANLLKMGPLWDFDSAFDVAGAWSPQHTVEFLHHHYLFMMDTFRNVYTMQWQALSPHLLSDIDRHLDGLVSSQGKAIDESRKLDSARWKTAYTPLEQEVKKDRDWLAARIRWMDIRIGEGL